MYLFKYTNKQYEKYSKKISIITPKKGDKFRLTKIALENAKEHYIGYTSNLKKRIKEHNSEDNKGYTRDKK